MNSNTQNFENKSHAINTIYHPVLLLSNGNLPYVFHKSVKSVTKYANMQQKSANNTWFWQFMTFDIVMASSQYYTIHNGFFQSGISGMLLLLLRKALITKILDLLAIPTIATATKV